MVRSSFVFITSLLITTAIQAEEKPQTGKLQLKFDQRSPLSTPDAMMKHKIYHDAFTTSDGTDYNLVDESFSVYVPAVPGKDKKYGLFVFAAPGAGDPPKAWLEVLNRHKLIWITPNDLFHKNQFTFRRAGLLLDALDNMKQKYPIDNDRIYLSGFSGGGLMASEMIHAFPDQFAGIFTMDGEDYYQLLDLDKGKRTEHYEPASWEAYAWDGDYDTIKKDLHLVMLTGEKDTWSPPSLTKGSKECLVMDGFQRVTYLEVPGGMHVLPPTGFFEKAIQRLEDPARSAPPTTAPSNEIKLEPTQLAQAKRILNSGLRALQQCDRPNLRKSTIKIFTDKAIVYFEQVIKDFPNSDEAKKAADLKQQIKDGKLPTTRPGK